MNAPRVVPSPGIQPEIAVGAIPDDERVCRSLLFVVVRTAIAARTTMPNTVLTTAR